MPTSIDTEGTGFALRTRNLVVLGAGAVALGLGYWLLSSGATTPASILLVLGYCVLIPVGLAL